MTLVHVTLDTSLVKDTELLNKTVSKIIDSTGMVNINQKRLYRYGIVSGEVSASQLQTIRELENVRAVEADQTRYATA
jgi:hypothetical protein